MAQHEGNLMESPQIRRNSRVGLFVFVHFCSEQHFALSASKVQQEDPFVCSKNSSCTVRIRINMNQLHDVDSMSNTAVLSNCQTVFLETKECK